MLQGVKASFHRSTVAYLHETEYPSEPVKILEFDVQKKLWIVELMHDRFKQQQIFVPEESLNLAYCLLPHNCKTLSVHGAGFVEQLRKSGRGLVSAGSYKRNDSIFEEYPFMISAADEKSSWRGRSRWHAYLLTGQAALGHEDARHALESFENLKPGTPPADLIEQVRIEAEMLTDRVRAERREEMHRAIIDILCIWQSNQFSFDNGSGLRASALFKHACLLNHSCSPTVNLVCRINHGAPGTEDSEAGRVCVTALADMEAGDELCHNYGPAELLLWPLEQRRQYFQKTYGFTCCCERCEKESLTWLLQMD
eukprot:TRINITY_DN94455_c0_g1_i1.p1 TRINITY_DN94455_c0_g1~~TRINITY_DN94455_c0_g1_i1.p1  ORF type:complete len:311 (-),score=54.28 TRINITY_DN94455_c0_g1_i1:70-1002(-)